MSTTHCCRSTTWKSERAAEDARNLATLTIHIDDRLYAELRDVAAREGITMSAFVREAVRRRVVTTRFERLRRRVAPFVEARGWLTDDDVFDEIS